MLLFIIGLRECLNQIECNLYLETPVYLIHMSDEVLAKFKEYRYGPEKMTWDPNCYECKVRYRDPKAKDLVMYLHAWRYKVII